MKISITTFITCVLFSFSIHYANATHNRAGEIFVEHNGNFEVKITVITYTLLQNVVADRKSLLLNLGDGKIDTIRRTQEEVLDDGFNKKNYYTISHRYNKAGWYVVSMTDPNRNAGILNINFPNSDGIAFHLQTSFYLEDKILNTTPQLNPPLSYAYKDVPFIYNLKASDKEGDILRFSLITPLKGKYQVVDNFKSPDQIVKGENNKISIDSLTGVLKWDVPQQKGDYTVAILVRSFRNGVVIDSTIRDMLITVNTPSTTALSDKDVLPRVKIAPNPITDEGFILFENSLKQPVNIAVYDILGRLKWLQNNHPMQPVRLRRADFGKGVYILKVESPELRYQQLVVFE